MPIAELERYRLRVSRDRDSVGACVPRPGWCGNPRADRVVQPRCNPDLTGIVVRMLCGEGGTAGM